MAMPKLKVPIYPRPVSPLHAESYHHGAQDVFYDDSCPSSEDDSTSRAAKRRRIEQLGEQYLRGDGLHILSAGLKGPFNKGWKNPWATRKRQGKLCVAEIPETTVKPRKILETKAAGDMKKKSSKVEEWLRRNSECSGVDVVEQSSPTSRCTRQVDLDKLLSVQEEKATKDAPHEAPAESDDKGKLSKPTQHHVSKQHDLQPRYARPPSLAPFEQRAPVSDNTFNERRVWVSHAANADRAEFAALQSKRPSLQVASPLMTSSPFEYGRVADAAKKLRKFEQLTGPSQEATNSMAPPAEKKSGEAAFENDCKSPTGSRGPNFGATYDDGARSRADVSRDAASNISIVAAALSPGTSRTSNANLPSAQPQSLALPTPSTNDAPTDEQLLEQAVEPVNITESSKQAAIAREDLFVSGKNLTPQVKTKVAADSNSPGVLGNMVPEALTLDTQQMLADISPMAFSTIKKGRTVLHRHATPVTVEKQKSGKRVGQISFAQGERIPSGSSQGSLKTSLRVSKGSSSVASGKENTSVKFGHAEADTHVFDVINELANQSKTPASSPRRLKSALKPSGAPPLAALLPSTKGSTSTGIVDGGQDVPAVEDDIFDLDGAIYDLGSYLGTWDAEQRESGVTTGI